MTEIVTGHRVSWRHEGTAIEGSIVCAAGKESICHKCDDQCAHRGFVPGEIHTDCLISRDIGAIGITLLYCGDRNDVHDGDVWIGWDGSDWVWWYAGDTHADLADPESSVPGIVDVITDLSTVDPFGDRAAARSLAEDDLSVVDETVGP